MNFFKTQSEQSNTGQSVERPVEQLRADILTLSQTLKTLKANYTYRGSSELKNTELLSIVAIQLKALTDKIDDSYRPQNIAKPSLQY